VRNSYPPVAEALDWLSNHAEPKMTGTGSCVFADFKSQFQAQQVLAMLPKGWHGFIAKGCNTSPLTQCIT